MKSRKLTKKQKLELYTKIVAIIGNHNNDIYSSAEILPFSGTKVGRTRIVTTDNVGLHTEQICHEIEDVLRRS